jgi:surface carbohydrate biosynthesis protein (TIGR04326 family)
MSESMRSTLLIWDRPGDAPEGDWTRILWRAFGVSGAATVSIPALLEERAVVLRARFLAWVHELGVQQIAGRTLIDRLQLRAGFSFWWMTLLVEKSNAHNSPQIISAIKLFALEDLLSAGWKGRVVLESADALLARTLRTWCGNAGFGFAWVRAPGSDAAPKSVMHRLYAQLPAMAQALVVIVRHLWKRRALRGTGAAAWRGARSPVAICSYLFNLDVAAAREGRLASAFWTELHSLLAGEGGGANWLFVYFEHGQLPDAAAARQQIEQFNARSAGASAHVPLDGAMSARVLMRALRDYFRIALRSIGLAARMRFRVQGSAIDLWPLFADDWRTSLRGPAALTNCLYFNEFEEQLRRLPKQRLGFYLLENISWEPGFVYCWQAAGHGKLVGVPHSTVRFWDLRYFADPRDYVRTGRSPLPLPDLVAVNGAAARAMYIEGGFPAERLVEVEALRYLHLNRAVPRTKSALGAPLRVLVLGDYVPSTTRQQMAWLAEAVPAMPADTIYIVKPHPACPIDPGHYPGIRMQLTSDPLDKLLGGCDVAYTSNMTSAAVDAYSFGVPVVSVLDGEAFNISPLRGHPCVSYVTNGAELAAALLDRTRKPRAPDATAYFHLDRGLPRWRRLLGLREVSPAPIPSNIRQ